MLKLDVFSPPSFGANCYILKDTESGDCLVVDPGSYDGNLKQMLKNAGVGSLKYILLTHGHFDHVCGVSRLHEDFGGKVVIHSHDEACLYDADKSLASYFGAEFNKAKADVLVTDGQELDFGKYKIKVMHTPGHTGGGVCYLIGDILFSGDTLFYNSIGRTDFPDSDLTQMRASLKKLITLEKDYNVYPGHDRSTTLFREKEFNPYLKGL